MCNIKNWEWPGDEAEVNASSGDCFHIVAPSLLILTFLRGKFGFAVRTDFKMCGLMFDIMKPICESACNDYASQANNVLWLNVLYEQFILQI